MRLGTRQSPSRTSQSPIYTDGVASEVWRTDPTGREEMPKEGLCRGWYRPSNLPGGHSLMVSGGEQTRMCLPTSSQQDSD